MYNGINKKYTHGFCKTQLKVPMATKSHSDLFGSLMLSRSSVLDFGIELSECLRNSILEMHTF